MKIGIVTITELDNLGNRLQNYALQQILRGYGHTVETIPNLIIYKKRKNPLYKTALGIYGLLYRLVRKDRGILSALKKQKRFEEFDAQYFSFSSKKSTINDIPEELDNDYDVFIAGSDQIWNSHFVFNFEFNFLRFAQAHKRISYAASFGSDFVKEEYVAQFSKYLSEMAYISVREIAGKRIVESLTNRTASVVLDPTMLMNASQWCEMEKKPKWATEEKYILVYYLGETQGQKELLNQLYREDEKFESYQLIDITDPNIPEQYAIRPDEFIWLIHHAELVVTDSFHGTVFSILFGTRFCSPVRRGNGVSMQSRFDSLFELLGIVREGLIVDVQKQPEVNRKLEENRRLSFNFLENALCSVEMKQHESMN